MGKTIMDLFDEWWEKEAYRDGDTSLFTAFEDGWSKGFRKSEGDCATRERLILDAIKKLHPDLDIHAIIVKALTEG